MPKVPVAGKGRHVFKEGIKRDTGMTAMTDTASGKDEGSREK